MHLLLLALLSNATRTTRHRQECPDGQPRKGKVEDDDVAAMEAMLDTGSLKPVPTRKRKFLSDEEDHTATGTIHIQVSSICHLLVWY
jgi:hypothetical protein